MRIRWRRPRFKMGYLIWLIFLGTIILVRMGSRTDIDEPVPSDRDLPPSTKNGSNRVVRSADRDLVNAKLVADRPPELRQEQHSYNGPFSDSRVPEGEQSELVDYHNYTQDAVDKGRVGLGEGGVAASIPSGLEKELDASYWNNGFNGILSDMIALDRSLPDIRHPACATYKYYKHLPTVSVVIPIFEEQLSALQRTVMSVINRSPAHLLKEIILVDDGSTTRADLYAPLEQWLSELAVMTRVLRLPERKGLITARQTGARVAVGDVIVVLDSHCEVMNNWLPPLLNPIVDNYRTTVCPLIDIIAYDTFAYFPQDNGARGAFDWHFNYMRLPLSPEMTKLLPKPFPNPVMNGGLFAISRKFFWELGGYDSGLAIWGGEQYDLSLKIWQCGGNMLDAPCSRVGHVFRGHPTRRPIAKDTSFLSRNYKRVGLLWMDEFIEALYRRKPEIRHVDAGDMSRELAIKEHLQCKSFKWFLETVAPDMMKAYPPVEPLDFAHGNIRNVFNNVCIDTGQRKTGDVLMYPCHNGGSQNFGWCWLEFIRTNGDQVCIESGPGQGQSPILYACNNKVGPPQQKWKYNPSTKQLHDRAKHLCLEVASTSRAVMSPCVEGNTKQQWEFQHLNMDRIREVFPEFSKQI